MFTTSNVGPEVLLFKHEEESRYFKTKMTIFPATEPKDTEYCDLSDKEFMVT